MDVIASVVYRTGPLTHADYAEAIEQLQAAQTQLEPDGRGCTVCWDSGHQAMECHHNPLVMARRAAEEQRIYRCFHCGQELNAEEAQIHFGPDERAETPCLPHGTKLLRAVMFTARDLCVKLGTPTDGKFPKAELNALNDALDAALGEA